jgi:hypothetical protein
MSIVSPFGRQGDTIVSPASPRGGITERCEVAALARGLLETRSI